MVDLFAGATLLDAAAPVRRPVTAVIVDQPVTAAPARRPVTAVITAESPLPRIRVRPIPDLSPPIIDPRAVVLQELSPFVQGTLAISFRGGLAPATDPRPPAGPADLDYFGPQRTSASQLPEPKAWAERMAQALVEVMSGARPAPQVIRWTTPEVYSVLARRHAASGRRTLVTRRAIVRKVRICEPADGVVEACAVVVDNGRVRALAMRLTGVDRRWVVSELQVG